MNAEQVARKDARRTRDRIRHAKNRAANPDKERTLDRTRRAANPDKARAYDRAYCAANRDKIRTRHRTRNLIKVYGLTLDAFDSLLAGQGGACAACGSVEWGARGPHVDHDHSTGKVRGILCQKCNLNLGLARDDPGVLRALADYLEEEKKR